MPAATIEGGFYLSVHGRDLGIAGDPIGSQWALIVRNKVVATSRLLIAKAVLGSNGAGPVTFTGVQTGDKVISVTNLTTAGDVTSSFEATISVAAQIQQTAATNLSAAQLLVVVAPQS